MANMSMDSHGVHGVDDPSQISQLDTPRKTVNMLDLSARGDDKKGLRPASADRTPASAALPSNSSHQYGAGAGAGAVGAVGTLELHSVVRDPKASLDALGRLLNSGERDQRSSRPAAADFSDRSMNGVYASQMMSGDSGRPPVPPQSQARELPPQHLHFDADGLNSSSIALGSVDDSLMSEEGYDSIAADIDKLEKSEHHVRTVQDAESAKLTAAFQSLVQRKQETFRRLQQVIGDVE